jgi:hypothetical protein
LNYKRSSMTTKSTCNLSLRRLGRILGVWGAVVALFISSRAEAVAKPKAVLANFTGPNAEEMRTAVAKALARQIDLVTDLEPVPKIHGRVLKQGGRWSLRLAVRDQRGIVLADETYDLREQRLYKQMPTEMAEVVARSEPGAAGPGAVAAAATYGEQVWLGTTIGLSSRIFQLKPVVAGTLLPAYVGSGPTLRIDVEAHPMTWFDVRASYLRNIGAALVYEAGPKTETKVKETNATYQAGSSSWEAGLFYRVALGDIVVRPGARLGAREFSVTGDGPPIPTVEYSYKSLGLDADVPLPLFERKLGLVADFRYLMLDGLKGVNAFAKTATGSAYSFQAGVRYRLPYRLEAAVLYGQTSFTVNFTGDAADGRTAKEGEDKVSLVGARLALAY